MTRPGEAFTSAATFAPEAAAPRPVRTTRFAATLSMPVQLQASVRMLGCESLSGARGALDGAIVLAGLRAVLTHVEGGRREHGGKRTVAREVTLIPAGQWFSMSDSPFYAPIAEGSPIRVQFRDCTATPLTEAVSLGQLGEPPLSFCVSFCVPVAVVAEIASQPSRCGPGSSAIIAGRLVFLRGIQAHYTFRPPGDRHGESRLLVGSAESDAVPIGKAMTFVSRLLLEHPSAKPPRSLAFLDGHGHRFGPNGHGGSRDPRGMLRIDRAGDSGPDEP